jgi:hypothetical protein
MQEPYIREGFGENSYDNLTTLHPLGIAALAVGMVWTLTASRNRAWLPILLVACFVSTSQRIVIATLDFNFIRAILVAAAVRIIARREYAKIQLTRLDKLVIAWVLVSAAMSTLRIGSFAAVIQKSGTAYDALGLYAVGRFWLRKPGDLRALSKALSVIAVIAAVGFLREHLTGRNIFSIFGGVSELTTIRDGRLRCQGPFSHPILAGTYWVGFLPLMAILIHDPKWRFRGAIGLFSIATITILCSSSTPLLGLIATAAFGSLWLVRSHAGFLRWSVFAMLLLLHMVMNGPVWSLIARVGVVGGSTGYHRYQLVNAFINNWTEWFMIGTNSTAHWGWFLFDVANQFVREGVEGGLITLSLFVMVLVTAFGSVGKHTGKRAPRVEAVSMWAVGTAIAAHCVMFIGISITHSNTNMLVFLWLLAATQASWPRPSKTKPGLGHRPDGIGPPRGLNLQPDTPGEAVELLGNS